MALENNENSMRVCRGCLATDARLYDMRQDRLMEAYNTLLSTAVQVTDDLPHYLCSYCAVLLVKCDAFRTKCIDSLIVLRNYQHQHIDLTMEQLNNMEKSTYFKQSALKNMDIVDKTLKQNYSNISTDTSSESDISFDSDMSLDSDDSIDSDFTDISDCSDSDNEINLDLKPKSNIRKRKIIKTEQDHPAKKANNEIKSLLRTYFDNERSGLLKDFKINIDCEASKAISNIRDHEMHQLSDIINHIQYSSEKSSELLKILDEGILKCENNASKYVNKTVKSKVIKQESNSNTNAKTINKQNFNQTGMEKVKQDASKSVIEIDINIKSDLSQIVDKKSEEIKVEVPEDLSIVFETESEEINETRDSDNDIAIADLELDSKPTKCKNINTNVKNCPPNYRSCKNLISGILKGHQKNKKKIPEETFAMYNTEVRRLSKEEQINEFNNRKQSKNYRNGQFKCDFCYKGFLAEEAYKNHMLLHDDISGKIVCDICQCHFMTKRCLYKHKKNHTKIYTCKECGHTTSHGSLATEHYKRHTGNKFSCKDCGKEFQKKSSKYGHIKMCHPTSEQLVRCEICGDSFNGLVGLKFHDKRSHKEMYSPECLCSGCDTQFYCSDAFKAHQGTDGLCDTLHKYCVRCGMSFETEELLKEHEIEQRKPQSQFKCDVCHKTFKIFTSLKMHQRFHSATYHNSIRKCNAKFNKTINENDQYADAGLICEVCGKSVKYAGQLKQHYLVAHLKYKPFKCTVCPKGYTTSLQLVEHMRVHTGERPFKCQHCPKTFSYLGNMKRHSIQVHTGARPYSCDICEKSYQSKCNLKLHIKTVHMKIPMPPRIRRRNKKTE